MPVVHVAVAVILNSRNEVLIQQRAQNTHQGGLWEFPGGKLETGEAVGQALEREIQEELGICVHSSRPLIKISHDYGDRSVLLDVHHVNDWSGQVQALEGQPIEWAKPEDLSGYAMPAADKPIVTALNLPSSYVITPPHIEHADSFLNRLDELLRLGERLFLYRVKSLAGLSHDELVGEMLSRCQDSHAKLLIHEKNLQAITPGAVDGLQSAGIHLPEQSLMQLQSGQYAGKLLSVSCHSVEALKRAEQMDADFAMLSPVEATASHPDARPIGWEIFSQSVEPVNLPVYALGGMAKDKTEKAWSYGAQGVAGISGWWEG